MGQRPPILHNPYFLVALALLLANDHFFKDHWPGAVTGKLSDFAGPVVVAFMIAAAVRRRSVAIVATTVGFTALKLSPAVAVLASPFLGGVTRTDPGDLIGLAALAPAWIVLGRVALDETRTAPALPATAPVDRPPRPSVSPQRAVALVAVGIVAMFSVTATSCDDRGLAFRGLAVVDEGVVAQLGDGTGEPTGYWLSNDSGLNWHPVDRSELASGGGGLDPAATRVDQPVQELEVCLDDGRCYRAIPGERIEERVDGEWVTSFRFTDEQVRRMQRRADGCSGMDRVDQLYSALAVTSVDGSPNGGSSADQTVIATMGPQGMLRLDPATGSWQRIGVGRYEPISVFGPRWLIWLVFAPVATLLASPLLLLVNRNRNVSSNRRAVAIVLNVVLSAVIGGLILFLLAISLGRLDYAWAGLVTVTASLVAFFVAMVVLLPPGKPAPPGRALGHPPGAKPPPID